MSSDRTARRSSAQLSLGLPSGQRNEFAVYLATDEHLRRRRRVANLWMADVSRREPLAFKNA